MTIAPASKLDQLRTMTDVVADTGDIDAIALYKPLDATTNPSLLLKAAQLPRYAHLLTGGAAGVDALAVAIGCEILSIIPGRVSTEVDARLSFDTQRIIDKAQHLMNLYAERGINHKRVLIKIAATWEGIRAAEVLEKRGIHCNLTLLFGFTQAAACADAGVTLISPFVGRILDWYKAHNNGKDYAPHEDPGVVSVTRIYHYYKQHGYNTIVMGASFRNQGEIEALAGCDRLTISPALLQQLADDTGTLQRQLAPTQTHPAIAKQLDNEATFRWSLNEDAMATEKLAEGIRVFTQDQIALEQHLEKLAH